MRRIGLALLLGLFPFLAATSASAGDGKATGNCPSREECHSGAENGTNSGPPGTGGQPTPSSRRSQPGPIPRPPPPTVNLNPAATQDQLVELPTWLWIDPNQWRPVSATATAGPVSSTVTATPKHVVWKMGDGFSVICNGPGTPYAS